jgi:hypothetical protein
MAVGWQATVNQGSGCVPIPHSNGSLPALQAQGEYRKSIQRNETLQQRLLACRWCCTSPAESRCAVSSLPSPPEGAAWTWDNGFDNDAALVRDGFNCTAQCRPGLVPSGGTLTYRCLSADGPPSRNRGDEDLTCSGGHEQAAS